MRLINRPDAVSVETRAYSLTIPAGRPFARLEDADHAHWADLALVGSVDSAQGLDDTAAIEAGEMTVGPEGWRIEVVATSSRWSRKVLALAGDEDSIRVTLRVEGDGDVTDVRLLGGSCSAFPRRGTGEMWSGRTFATLFSPEPADPAHVCRPASEPAALDIFGGGGNPGRGHWFFTPPPFCYAFARTRHDASATSPASIPAGRWLGAGIAAPIAAQTFTSFEYQAGERSFSFVLRYEGQTHFAGSFESPALVLRFANDPYRAIGAYAGALRRSGEAPPVLGDLVSPAWWREPMFCGWGAQSRVALRLGIPAPLASSQEHYDAWLERLAERDLRPGTVVVDDKWQATYGDCQADAARWPDLARWIASRHEAGQRVLLWWKAWDPEGVDPDLCIRNAAGIAVTTDPSNPGYEARLRNAVRRMLAAPPEGYGADGLKIDFTGLAPSGAGLRRHGSAWGVALLHRLLEIVASEARAARPDALLVTHTPNPAFVDVTSMLRLNDMLRFDEPDDPAAVVPQMLHRAKVVQAACPSIPIDTDDWCAPDLQTWRAYQQHKLEIGVPALYYVDGLDRSSEEFEPADYALTRRIWATARANNHGSVAGERVS